MGDPRAFYIHEESMSEKTAADLFFERKASRKPTKLNERRLWEDFKKGDTAAFELIYAENANHLYNYGRQFTQNMDLVKDCIQDLFVDLSERANRLGETDTIKFYLLKSFRRRLHKSLKKENKISSINDVKEIQLGITLSHEVEWMNDLLDAERIHQLNNALHQLTLLQREAIFLFYYEGMTYAQIAELFEFSRINSARELIQRGIDALSEFLKP
jgi:RNA polymerase sigma factor (sigma-70 family)